MFKNGFLYKNVICPYKEHAYKDKLQFYKGN